jgi:hypothetical protein
MNLAHAVDATCVIQDAFGGRRFAGINMSDDADITNPF